MDEWEAQVQEELRAIMEVLENLLGRRSRWNGEVELIDDASVFGRALWSGRVAINRELIHSELRWRTEIHEALHTFSVGLTPVTYETFTGWEEGVVEQLQRILRPRLLQSLKVSLPESLFVINEADHRYNRYTEALESLRLSLRQPDEAFYLRLLSVPLEQRANDVIKLGQQLPRDDFARFRQVFSASFTQLRK